jgi:SAM-dependent methyltransferase
MGRITPHLPQEVLNRYAALGTGSTARERIESGRPFTRRLRLAVVQAIACSDHLPLAGAFAGVLEHLGARTVPLTLSLPLSLPREASILVQGCSGRWLRTLQAMGYRNLAALAQPPASLSEGSVPGIRLYRAGERLPAQSFDCVRLENVLEHLWDPLEGMAELRRALKPNGSLVVQVPDFRSWSAQVTGSAWSELSLPLHCNQFTEEALRRLGGRLGLTVARIQRLPLWEVGFVAVTALVGRERPRWSPWVARSQKRLAWLWKRGDHSWARATRRGDELAVHYRPFQRPV